MSRSSSANIIAWFGGISGSSVICCPDIIGPHQFSSGHHDLVVMSDLCGCFHCLAIFKPTSILDWIDGEEWDRHATTLCPRCGIDTVLPSASGTPIEKMRRHWFGEYENHEEA
jgi:hypothetical protein